MKQNKSTFHKERNWKILSNLKRIGCRIAGAVTFAMTVISFHATKALAISKAQASVSDADDLTSGFNGLIGLAENIVIGIGVIIALFGGLQLGLGVTQDNADAQSRGVKFLIGGIIGASVTAIIKLVTGK